MSDPLIEAQISTVFNYPVQSMCFIVGGLLTAFSQYELSEEIIEKMVEDVVLISRDVVTIEDLLT